MFSTEVDGGMQTLFLSESPPQKQMLICRSESDDAYLLRRLSKLERHSLAKQLEHHQSHETLFNVLY